MKQLTLLLVFALATILSGCGDDVAERQMEENPPFREGGAVTPDGRNAPQNPGQ